MITNLNNLKNIPDLAFATAKDRRELPQKILAEVKSKSWTQEEEKESAALLDDGNLFYGLDGKSVRKGLKGKTAGFLKDSNSGQDMAYLPVKQKKTVNKSAKEKGKSLPHSPFFKSLTGENERRKKQNQHSTDAKL